MLISRLATLKRPRIQRNDVTQYSAPLFNLRTRRASSEAVAAHLPDQNQQTIRGPEERDDVRVFLRFDGIFAVDIARARNRVPAIFAVPVRAK